MTLFYDQSPSSSSISIYYNSGFSLDDVESVLRPLFENYYGIRQLRSIISSADHTWCVYDRRINQYIACALLLNQPNNNVLYLNLFGVAEISQGQGIGTRLLKIIKRWARKNGYSAIFLHTRVDNVPAIRLYEKVGFQKQYHVPNFYRQYGFFTFFAPHEPNAYQMILYL
jgi:ribosomal protein S18 acetylase RimI-like enzyme